MRTGKPALDVQNDPPNLAKVGGELAGGLADTGAAKLWSLISEIRRSRGFVEFLGRGATNARTRRIAGTMSRRPLVLRQPRRWASGSAPSYCRRRPCGLRPTGGADPANIMFRCANRAVRKVTNQAFVFALRSAQLDSWCGRSRSAPVPIFETRDECRRPQPFLLT